MSFEPEGPIEEPASGGLDPESAMLHSAATSQREANIFELKNFTIQTSANRFEQSRLYVELGNFVDQITNLEGEAANRQRREVIKKAAILGATALGAMLVVYVTDKIVVKPFIESWRYFSG